MKKKRYIIFIIFILIIFIFLVYLRIILNEGTNEEQNEKLNDDELDQNEKDKPKVEPVEYESIPFKYGEYNLSLNETIEVGDYSFLYEHAEWNIRVKNKHTNETLCHFWRIRYLGVRGLNEFQAKIISCSESSVKLNFTPYNKSDYLGEGVFFLNEYNKTFRFDENETFIYKNYYLENETAEIKVITDEKEYIVWVTSYEKIDLGFVIVKLRAGYGIECG